MGPILPGPGDRVPPALTEHLLEEIFFRIGAPADLIRASAACKTFRRLIIEPTFLRRYRSLHPPLLLGFIAPGCKSDLDFLPADAPHPNAPAARAFAGAADFSCKHLPDRRKHGWFHCDARDGRFLIQIPPDPKRGRVLSDLAVCDPLTRGYTLLPPIPDGLVASVLVQVQCQHVDFSEAFFDPSGDYEEEQFRVICWTRCPENNAVFIYSSVSSSWTGTSIGWDALGFDLDLLGPDADDDTLDSIMSGQWPTYAYGCLYWRHAMDNKSIKFNINSMEFSTVSLPADYDKRDIAIVEAGEGKIGMFSLICGPEHPRPLCCCIRQNESENVNEHTVEITIPLPQEYDKYHFDGSAPGYVFLIGMHRWQAAFFLLEIKTMKIERVCISDYFPEHLIPYFGFPPLMSPRRI